MRSFEKYWKSPYALVLWSGLLLWLSWPARGIPILAFIALVPLLSLEDRIREAPGASHRYAVLGYAWLSFLLFNALTTWWIWYASIAGFLVAMVLNSFFMALPFALMHAARRILPARQGQGALVILWLAFEYLHMNWEMSWSWLNLGNVFASTPQWVQWYEYTGVLGGSFWILVMNLAFYALLKTYQARIETIRIQRTLDTSGGNPRQQSEVLLRDAAQFALARRRALLGLMVFFLLMVPPLLSVLVEKRVANPQAMIEVVVVQPAVDPYAVPANEKEARQQIEELIQLANQQITPQTRYIVAPEVALPGALWLHQPHAHAGFAALSGHAQEGEGYHWIGGVMAYRLYDKADTPTARPLNEQGAYYDAYNAAFMVDAEGNYDFYFKSRLVPGIERMPYSRWLKPLGKLVTWFGGTAFELGTQAEPGVFTGSDGLRIAPVICYESIYGEYVAGYVRRGAQLIFILTNDGWWRNTPGYRQHHEYARLRAVETRRSIARAALTGTSSFIDPKGKVYQATAWWAPTSIRLELALHEEITFYVRNGDFLGRLAVFFSILFALYAFTQRKLKGGKILG